MLAIEDVLSQFGSFSRVPREQWEDCRSFCLRGLAYVETHLRPDVDTDSPIDRERLCAAAAARAYCDYRITCGCSATANQEVRVGDISLRSATGEETFRAAVELRDYFMAQVADLLEPDHLPLRAVETP